MARRRSLARPRREAAGLFYLGAGGTLTATSRRTAAEPDSYTYDPADPTPTKGGSIVSYVYPPGSVDVSDIQQRADVLTYTTEPLQQDLDVVGPLRVILYASSSAVDTDFVARLTDVFPDGRAIQLQSRRAAGPLPRPATASPASSSPGASIGSRSTCGRPRTGSRPATGCGSTSPQPTFPGSTATPTGAANQENPSRPARAIYHDAEHPSHLEVRVLPR